MFRLALETAKTANRTIGRVLCESYGYVFIAELYVAAPL
jgi:hypothetical protein